jgi:hypothetical protein
MSVPHGQKIACLRARPSRGRGGNKAKSTPVHAKWSNYDMHNRPHAMLGSSCKYVILQGWISKQAVLADHVFSQTHGKNEGLSLKLSWRIRIKNSKRCTQDRSWRAERATSTWSAAHFRPFSAVQKGPFLSSCKQFNYAKPKPGWFWHAGGVNGVHMGPLFEVVTCDEVIYRGELPVGHIPVAWPPVHFWLPIGGLVLSFMYMLPF